MTERLLQYIWQFRYFSSNMLHTTTSQVLQIINPGSYNTNQGPDFLNAKIKVDGTIWAGSIELHIRTSEWLAHKHSQDSNYNNVILHVVWMNDIELQLPFPALELQHIVPKLLLDKFNTLMQGSKIIPCENQVSNIEPIHLLAWKTSLLSERLQSKTKQVESFLKQNKMNWEETCWWMLARNFGATVNSDAFEKIAQSIPVNLLVKHRHQFIQLEAMLMGQAGLLEKTFTDDYPVMLQKEFIFLKHKYKLKNPHAPLYFLRMRPANFPTIRLSQLAGIVYNNEHLFSKISEATSITAIENILSVTANDYWHYHYLFDEPATFKIKNTGKQITRNIMINTVVPMIHAYGQVHNNEKYINKAIQWLTELPAEQNKITAAFKNIGIENKSAYDSQALIQLKHFYCDQKQCLQCAIGNSILK